MAELRAPNLCDEIPIGTAYQYVEEVDPALEQDMIDMTETFFSLETIIAYEVAIYLMSHVGGKRTFDQATTDHLRTLLAKEKTRFEEISGKEYISKNDDW